MPFQGLPWTEFISCPVCFKLFNEKQQRPISLGCGHTVCKSCIKNRLSDNRCPFDQTILPSDVDKLPANFALMHLVGAAVPEQEQEAMKTVSDHPKSYELARKCIEDMAVHLKPLAENPSDDDSSTCSEPNGCRVNGQALSNSSGSLTTKCVLSRPMQRKLISLIHCQLLEEEGRSRAARIARSLGERIVSELLVLHQYPHQLSANLWAAVRTRGCQFLGPAMQEEVLKLILLALEDGSFLSRKVLVLFVVQRLESRYPQASKTAIGHVVQLLYRASCFKVLKRDEESSLMQLKEEFCQYESLRREHDSQIVQIAIEAGLRISPEQWSSLLYGDPAHKSHMQSIIDKHQSPQSFGQSVIELMLTLQRNGDQVGLLKLQPQLEFLSSIDPSPDCPAPSWENLEAIMRSLNGVMSSFVDFLSNPDHRSRLENTPVQNTRYKTSLCRDFSARETCPRGNTCTFAHSQDELERYRSRSRRSGSSKGMVGVSDKMSSALTPAESDQLRQVQLMSKLKIEAQAKNSVVKLAGDITSVPEILDPVVGTSTVTQDLPAMFNTLTLGQPQNPSLLPKVPTAVIELMGNTQNDSENPLFIAAAPQMVTETRLTFSCQGLDVPDNPNIPTLGPQTCFHPNSASAYPHSSFLQNSIAAGQVHRQPPPTYIPAPPRVLMQPTYPAPPPVMPQLAHPIQSIPLASGPAIGTQLVPTALAQSSDFNMNPIGLMNQQPTTILCGGCVPCVPQHVERPPLMPYPFQGIDTLEALNTRKQQIITNLQEEPVFMDSNASVYLSGGGKGFAGLKTVLSANKYRQTGMPKSVSDMFVATRSTQSLDEMINEDIQTLKWSSGEDPTCDVAGNVNTFNELPGSSPDTGKFLTSGASVVRADFETGSDCLFTSVESSRANAEDSMTTQSSTSNDAEFCSFPNDDGDETIIPFEHISVSKFGPISRMSKVKTLNSAPVQVTADSYKWMTPVSVTPSDRPSMVASTMSTIPSRFLPHRGPAEFHPTEPSVKPTPLEIPSIWQHTPLPSYQNIARMKAGAAEAVTNNERLAYELQAVELEIAMKTGKEPESFTKIIQDAVMASSQGPAVYRPSSDLFTSKSSGSLVMSMSGSGNLPLCYMNLDSNNDVFTTQQKRQQFMANYHRPLQGIKK